jgi:hypothetical protein
MAKIYSVRRVPLDLSVSKKAPGQRAKDLESAKQLHRALPVNFNVGHRLFSGLNALAENLCYQQAYQTLLRRGVTMEDAHAALKYAMQFKYGEAKVWSAGKSKIIQINLVEEQKQHAKQEAFQPA